MEDYKLKANEQFFDGLLKTLNEGGVWGWPEELEIFIKKDKKLIANRIALKKIRKIVRQEYFEKHFSEE